MRSFLLFDLILEMNSERGFTYGVKEQRTRNEDGNENEVSLVIGKRGIGFIIPWADPYLRGRNNLVTYFAHSSLSVATRTTAWLVSTNLIFQFRKIKVNSAHHKDTKCVWYVFRSTVLFWCVMLGQLWFLFKVTSVFITINRVTFCENM